MPPLPAWLVSGLALAGALAVVFAFVFLAGERLFPTAPVDAGASNAGEERRRREIRAYLDAIGEHYVEGHSVAGLSVDFYLPDRDVAVTFDAAAYVGLGATDTHAVLAEHEMPGAALGARLPFDTPQVSGTGAASGAPSGAFETLGVEVGADAATVRRAYRERLKEVHPDHGGDEARFRRVREAYATVREHVE